MMKEWVNSKYGELPFKEVQLVDVSFTGPKDREETAFIQYNLLMKKEILQGHLEFRSGKGKFVITKDADLKKLFTQGSLKAKVDKVEVIPYENVVDANYLLRLQIKGPAKLF